LAHSEQLRGADVVVCGDHDEPGRAHVAAICQGTFGVANSVSTIELNEVWPEIPDGGDISDFVAKAGHHAEKLLEELVNDARSYRPEDSAKKLPQAPVPVGLPWNNIAWDGVEVPQQVWTVTDLIPANEVCLFSGYGGGGKSTLGLQLAGAHARGMNWLGAIPEQGPAFFIDAEDHIAVVHRRLAAITRLYGCSYQDLIDGGLHILSLHGKPAVMATADHDGVVKPTELYLRILQEARALKPVQIIIAPSSHVYSGSEIDRSQVTQFVSLLSQLAAACGGSVILISHPSLTGMANQSGISGSTGWHNAVRARMYLETLKNGDGADQQPEHELRVLRFLKNQYGPPAKEITLRYQNGLFLPERQPTDYEKASKEAKIDIVFMDLMQSCKGRTPLSPNQFARNYAPTVFVKRPEAAGIKKGELTAAMERLLKRGTLTVKEWGPPSNRVNYLEIVE
jgi:RecA-family ATPase